MKYRIAAIVTIVIAVFVFAAIFFIYKAIELPSPGSLGNNPGDQRAPLGASNAASIVSNGPYEVQVKKDIKYATVGGTDLYLDLYQPKDVASPTPIVIFAHGSGGDKKVGEELGMKIAERGYSFASINYRLSGAVMPEPMQDVFGSVRFLRANASTYNLDSARVVLSGNSAGSVITSIAGVMANEPGGVQGSVGGNLEQPNLVQGVLAIGGEVYSSDLDTFRSQQMQGPIAGVFGCTSLPPSATCSATLEKYLAEYNLDAEDPPFLILQGLRDTTVPPANAEHLAAAMKSAGMDVTYITNPNVGHGLKNAYVRAKEIAAFLDGVFAK